MLCGIPEYTSRKCTKSKHRYHCNKCKKCVHEGKHSAALKLGYTADWDFKLTKQWKDGTHKEEKKISVDEFENAFDVINTNIEESAEAHAAKVAKGIEKTTTKLERKLNKMSNVEVVKQSS